MALNMVGMHDREGSHLVPGWCLITEELGLDNERGGDYCGIVAPIVRLNHRYHPGGTLPKPEHYARFAEVCAGYVRNSRGCRHWIIGNEPNLRHEWPEGQVITAADYARCFNLCRAAIRRVQPEAVVIPAPIGPWNVEAGDWLAYWKDVLGRVSCEGLAIHAYGEHGAHFMGPPYSGRRYGFWAYRDLLEAVPPDKRGLPVYMTECNPNRPWTTGWFPQAVEDVRTWNLSGQRVHGVLPYCYINRDQFGLEGHQDVLDEIRGVYARGYSVEEGWPHWDAEGFVRYAEALDWGAVRPNKVFLHHTWKPTGADWRGAATMDAMYRVYRGYGWSVFPHLFVAEDGIWQMWDLRKNGAGVVGQNDRAIHVEMVGDYDRALPGGNTWANTKAVLRVLLRVLGLREVLFHRDYADKSCPGSAVTKEWVRAELGPLPEHETATDPAVVAEKARWWLEEAQRMIETGDLEAAQRFNKSLIVLLYRLEKMLKG
jgi:hypothetical protein